MALAMLAQANVRNAFNKYSRIPNRKGITGAQAAEMILRRNNINDVTVEQLNGHQGDHYDPQAKAIRLSYENYNNPSLCAIAVASHEAGHAIQHATNYAGIRARWAFLKPAQLGSSLGVPLAIAGMIFQWSFLIDIGIIFFTGAVIFQLITLPVEFNASSRAMAQMADSGLLLEEEVSGARKLLNAAALTYVAAAAVAVGELVRLLIIRNSMND
jgi:uncharacterized protein